MTGNPNQTDTAVVQTAKPVCPCGELWSEHRLYDCPGNIVCGGYLPHNCSIPGCMEPEFGVHGAECPGYNIGCPPSLVWLDR